MTTEEKTKPQQDYLDSIASFVAEREYGNLPESVRQHAKYVWMDTVGVILAGSLEPQNAALAGRLSDDRGAATILRTGFPHSDPRNAAMANGTAGTFLELDEGHRPTGHPSIYIVPPVLALGESTGATGKQLIEALVLAYEVTSRLAWATRLIQGVHVHGCLGVVGAAVGAAKLLGYPASRIREAINVASCLNGATPLVAAFDGALVRNAYAGFSGHMGIIIADLVESGFTGPADGLSETYTRIIADNFEPRLLVAGLGDDYQITTNYFKMHAACRHLHAPLDALEQALNGRALRPQEVKQVTAFGNAKMAECRRPDPNNALAAKFSVPFGIATGIARNSTGIDAFRQEAVDDPVTRDLAERVVVEVDDGFNRRWPQEQASRVEILLNSGETLVGQVDNPRSAEPNPAGYAELKAKFSSLTSTVFPNGNDIRALDLFMRLEEIPRAGDLTAALRELAG